MKIIFVCHGNICRSPAAEVIFKSMLKEEDNIDVVSLATSMEEIGNDIYPPMKRVLLSHGYDLERHYAARITASDLDSADYVFYMDNNNLYYLERLFGSSPKFHLISCFSDNKEVEDPWYTDRFEYVYQSIKKYCEEIYKKVTIKW